MSVYRKGRFFHYDFVLKGRRYYGSTGQDTKRSAEAVERQRRLEAATGIGKDAGEMTLDMAASRYWDEVGQDKRDAKTVERRLAMMLACVGPHKLLREIDAPDIVEAIAKRRGLNHKGRRPSNTTVNRDLIDTTLRPLLNRARKVWKAKGMPEIDWRSLRLSEPKPQHREYSQRQMAAWKSALDPVARFALHLLLTYGLRRSELKIRPADVDGEAKRLTIPGKYRKHDEALLLPLRDEDARIMAAMASRATALKLEYIWHEGDQAISFGSLDYRLRKAAKDAGLDMPRVIHGARHHAGTTMLRKTGNLKLAQRLLGHASIQSTVRYANASEDDLRAALDGLSPNSPEAVTSKSRKKARKQ
ncbi:site-specific integrase [Henriciella sp.]|uniref:tyrosine-type recombinase/integrase n=1 Tax=Henriciella sp. TaxID=1968823 RepID=UPI002624DB07|nr:site-specific integrase [Henriciella sp.]